MGALPHRRVAGKAGPALFNLVQPAARLLWPLAACRHPLSSKVAISGEFRPHHLALGPLGLRETRVCLVTANRIPSASPAPETGCLLFSLPSPDRLAGVKQQPTHSLKRRLAGSPPVAAWGDGQGQLGGHQPVSLPEVGLWSSGGPGPAVKQNCTQEGKVAPRGSVEA